ncbi:hypothetical protein DH2020_029823 [Rehmannia glutinosa]|uniref:Pre-mRNA polyadenylation factor Fip1 domain-containing protein n=1 Tax=Rehmannia glutinosa TaxID=99300 RepID=A0ABR0VRL6_REHGL
MEDDDEFGDLYTDVLRPLSAQLQTQRDEAGDAAAAGKAAASKGRSTDININSDDEEILYGAPDLKNQNLNRIPKNLVEPRGFDLNLDSNLEAARIDGLAGNGGDDLGLQNRVSEKGEGVKVPLKTSGGSNFMEDDDDINILLEDTENKDGALVEKEDSFRNKQDDIYITAGEKENTINFVNKSVDDEMGLEQRIPGLSGKLDNPRGSNFEDEWESEESEDDLQIVLNDNNHGPMEMERMTGVIDEDDEDGEPLVIVADNGDVGHHQTMTEEPVWRSEEGGPEAGGEKDLGDAAKASGGGGGVVSAAMQPKTAYNNHVYHHPFHSQFKLGIENIKGYFYFEGTVLFTWYLSSYSIVSYCALCWLLHDSNLALNTYVRPGAVPLPAAAPPAPGGIPSQVRPPVSMGPLTGRGRGDWRPVGIKGVSAMQKGFNPGYGMPAWGANTAGRGYGSGLDFTLPSHKTIFEVDIDSFEDKPWRLPSIDVSDFFNFGLNEDSWRDYCKQLEQLRLETTMQSKIRVYESGRAEQDYDPDLPPELAAAVGIQDIQSQNANPGKADAGPTDLARGSERGRPPLPVGRPIPVETGSVDRLPSIDTRRPRMHDTDAIIEIVCHSSPDSDDMADQQDNDPARKDLEGGETDDLLQDDKDDNDSFSPAYNGQKRKSESRRAQLKNTVGGDEIVREDVLRFPPDIPSHYPPDREIGVYHEERSTKGRRHVRSSTMTANDSKRGEHITDDLNEESIHSGDGKLSPLSSSRTIGSDEEQAVVVGNEMNDRSGMHDRSFDMEREEVAVDETTGHIREDGNLTNSTKKQKRSSQVEQLSQQEDDDDDDDGEDSKGARRNENSKARSESSQDHRRFPDDINDEVHQDRYSPPAVNIKKQIGDEDNARRKGRHERDETGRYNTVAKGIEDSFSHRGGDANSLLHWHVNSESADWRKESDMSEGSWHRRDEDNGRRIRVEDPRKREHGGEIVSKNRGKFRETEKSEKNEHHLSRNQLDNGSWRGANRDIMVSRQKERDNNPKSRYEQVDDLHSKRRKEEAHKSREHAEKEDIPRNQRESSSRRKRDRDDDGPDQLKRDEQTRLEDDDVHYARQKEARSFQRERSERQRERDEWYRIKQDEDSSRREREETRPVMRSGRAAEDKTWISQSRGKDNYKGSGREYHPKDVTRHDDQLKRRDRVDNGSISQPRVHGDIYARGNQLGSDDKKARYERPNSRDGRVAYGSDTSRVLEHKQKESSRKNKESESGDHNSLIPSKRNHDEHGGQINETVNLRGRTEQQSGEVHVNHHRSSRKHNERASSEDEQPDSRKGRSKLERWTSHKDKDFGITSSSLKTRDLQTHEVSSVSRPPQESSEKLEDNKPHKDTGAEINVNLKVVDDNKHLDTVEKLKKAARLSFLCQVKKMPQQSRKWRVNLCLWANKLKPAPIQRSNQNARHEREGGLAIKTDEDEFTLIGCFSQYVYKCGTLLQPQSADLQASQQKNYVHV